MFRNKLIFSQKKIALVLRERPKNDFECILSAFILKQLRYFFVAFATELTICYNDENLWHDESHRLSDHLITYNLFLFMFL